MSPEQIREEQRASRDGRPAPIAQPDAYRPWDQSGRPDRWEAEADR